MKIKKKINHVINDLKTRKFKILINRLYREFLRIIFKFQSSKNKVRILDENWDNLIILDTCRYDFFKKNYEKYLDGKLERKKSLGSSTREWLIKNFNKKTDIMYVSANPHLNNANIKNQSWNFNFYKIIEAWDDEWDDKINSVHPARLVKLANKLDKNYPNKRKIIHFIQPHLPYLTKSKEFNKYIYKKQTTVDLSKKDISEMKKGYEENLKIVLKELNKLKLRGKTIITSDHGECFGEYGLLLHHDGIYIKSLIEVPWFIFNKRKATN